jgi:hypothetical protein
MYYKHVKEKFELSYTEGFHKFDGVLMVINMETTQSVDDIMSGDHIGFLENETGFSWDGAMFWFKRGLGEKFLAFADKWFEENYEDLTDDMNDDGLSNILLYAQTKTGMVFVDTQRDMNSVIDTIVNEFLKIENVDDSDMSTFFAYDDCHLIDNLCFGRDMNTHGNQVMYFLYQEGFLDETILFNALYNNYEPNMGYSVAVVGDFCVETHIIENAIEACEGLTLLDVPNKNTWVWVGDNVSEEDLESLKANYKLISPIADVVKKVFEESFNY